MDLRAYWPCHRMDGTAGTQELLPQLSQPGLGTISDDYGLAATRRSMDLAAAAGSPRYSQESTTGRRCSWRMGARATPCDGTDDHATAGSGPTRQSGSTGLEVQCKPTRRGMRWVFIFLTSCSFFLGESGPFQFLGRAPNSNQLAFIVVTILLAKIVTGFESE